MSYSLLKKIITVMFLVYFVVGIATQHITHGERTVYPFFSWYLFYKVPERIQTDFAVRVQSVQGEYFDPSLPLEDETDLYNSRRYNSTQYYYMIQYFGRSVERKDLEESTLLKKKFDEQFVKLPVTYILVKRHFNPIDLWKYGTVLSEEIVEVFTTESSIPSS